MGQVAPDAGMLLVASPELTDPNFSDAVVLLLDADDDGALGLVLNRPSTVSVADVLEPWRDLVAEPEVLFRGGPVSPEGALAVGVLRSAEEVPVGFRSVAGRLGLIDLDTPVELVEGSLAGLRVFAGYAGWSAGQLEREIAQGDWDVVPGDDRDVIRPDLTDLWHEVLRRQPGQLAWRATRPTDPEMN